MKNRHTMVAEITSLLLLAAGTAGAQTGITSWSTYIHQDLPDTGPVSTNVIDGWSTGTGHPTITTANVTYNNETRRVSSISTASGTYEASGVPGTIAFRRTAGGTKNVFWTRVNSEDGPYTINGNSASVTLRSQPLGSANAVANAQNINNGMDGPFNNTSDIANDIERIDYTWGGGINEVGSIFSLFDRGGNDEFKIAPILALDGSGIPTAYGTLLTVQTSSWGNTLEDTVDTLIFSNDDIYARLPTQPIKGIGFSVTDFGLPADQLIYGYSIFAGDVTATAGDDLLDWTNETYFPRDTPNFSNEGGLDPLFVSQIFRPIPEPSTALIGALGLFPLLRRRRSS